MGTRTRFNITFADVTCASGDLQPCGLLNL